MNFVCLDTTGYYNFPTQWIVCLHKLCHCFGSGNKTMSLPIKADPDELFAGDPKVNASNWPLTSPLQLSQPLVRGIKVACNGHSVNTLG
jgi:hypothetical protein